MSKRSRGPRGTKTLRKELGTGLRQWEELPGAGSWARSGWTSGTKTHACDWGLRACSPQVEMLYEEALYTVLHRAGTMGPDQVDDEEALLGYLQQVSQQPCPLYPILGTAKTPH